MVTTGSSPDEVELTVQFFDEDYTIGPAGSLTFGRAADIVVDGENKFLHRVVGRLSCRGGTWVLDHLGTRTRLTVRSGRSVTTVEPGGSVAILGRETVVRCIAGPAHYELWVYLDLVEEVPPAPLVAAPHTVEYGWFELNAEQRELSTALAARYLSGRGDLDDLPSNREIAHRLGWSITKFNRKLDHLCAAAARAGVVGVSGDIAAAASQRRARLVEHMVRVGMVTAADVDTLGCADI